jgi:hypothetical protein
VGEGAAAAFLWPATRDNGSWGEDVGEEDEGVDGEEGEPDEGGGCGWWCGREGEEGAGRRDERLRRASEAREEGPRLRLSLMALTRGPAGAPPAAPPPAALLVVGEREDIRFLAASRLPSSRPSF